MRTGSDHVPDERTARARIRDAAIDCVIAEGFTASVRAIARRAEVSGGLIEYHFGSKAALFDACDAHVGAQMAAIKDQRIADAPSTSGEQLMQTLLHPEYAWMLGYLVRAMQAGGPRAAALHERLLADTRRQFERAEELNLVTPSRDPDARARWSTATSIGSLLVIAALHPEDDPTRLVQRFVDDFMLPAIEGYTEPVLADSTYLDLYLQARDAMSPTSQEPR